MVSEAEFTMSLAKFGKTSADVRLAADVISGVMLKFGPYLNQIATNTGLISLASKVLGVIFGV